MILWSWNEKLNLETFLELERWSPKLSYFFGLCSPSFLIDYFLIKRKTCTGESPKTINEFKNNQDNQWNDVPSKYGRSESGF